MARRTVGFRPRSGWDSLLVEMLAAVEESRAERLAGDKKRHRELVKRNKAQLRANRERVVSEMAVEIEDGFNRNNIGPAFCAIKWLSSVQALDVNTQLKVY